jgi:fucose permease
MMMWSQQPYYTAIGLDPAWFGVLMASGFFMGSLASNLGHLLDHRFRNRTVLMVMLCLEVALLAGSGLLHNLGGALLLISGSLFWGMGWPRVQDAINKRADSYHRATVLSTASMMIHLLFIPLSLMLGWISDHFGIHVAVLGLIFLPAIAMTVTARMILRDWKIRKNR